MSPKVDKFIRSYGLDSLECDVWSFGERLSEKLIGLVVSGDKRATSSVYKNNDASKMGGYGVIIDNNGDPRCIVRYTKTDVVPFNDVTADFASKEGEGFANVSQWRDSHLPIFMLSNPNFTNSSSVLCEEFELIPAP